MLRNKLEAEAATTPRTDRKSKSSRSAKRARSILNTTLGIETLERRQLLAAAVAATEIFHTQYVRLANLNSVGQLDSFGLTGDYSPIEIREAYGFDKVSFSGGKVAADGSGETIAIVDAYDDPNIVSDLHQFDVHFGLADPTFTKVNQTGGSTMPVGDADWAGEISLDVEWAHAIAPKAKILLVEATDASPENLDAAVDYAAAQPGVVVVSNSYGGGEYSDETTEDSNFVTPAGHAGVTFVVSAGDDGAPANYPSASPNVLSVGGTSLQLTKAGAISSESAWTGTGGGVSEFEAQPAYQNGIVTQSKTNRATPDVSYDSDPATGFPVYDTYGMPSPWGEFGGTSDAAPQWAALVAIADQGRSLAGLQPLSNQQLMVDLYAMPAANFNDVTSGHSTGTPSEFATKGYDLSTGLGSPKANLIIASLVGGSATTTAPTTQFALSAPSSLTSGATFSLTVTAESATGATTPAYTGTVHFTSTDGLASLPANYTYTAADNGVHTFTGLSLSTVGGQSVTATDTATSTIKGSAAVTVTALIVSPSATHFSISDGATATAGTAFSVTVTALTSSNTTATTYSGAVHFTSNDTGAGVVLPTDYTFTAADHGVHTFTGVVLVTAGPKLITATDKTTSSITGTSATTTVAPGAANHLVFGQQPGTTVAGSVMTPAVTVRLLDQFGNLLTGDTTDHVTVSLATTPGGTLGGTLTATVSGGVATFSNLTLSAAGSNYSIKAISGSLAAITSSSFTVTSVPVVTPTVIESFESGNLSAYSVAAGATATASVSSTARHDGALGLVDATGNDWIYRNDAAAQVKRGDTISVWVQFTSTSASRAYFGFGTTSAGGLSLVAAPNTNQLILQNNAGFGYTDVASVSQTYTANTWYQLVVKWGTSGSIVGQIYNASGTLLSSVSATNTTVSSGGFGFRSFGSNVYWDTVARTSGVNSFALPATVAAPATVVSSAAVASTVSTASVSTSSIVKPVTSTATTLTTAQLAATDAVHASGTTTTSKGLDDLITTVASALLQHK